MVASYILSSAPSLSSSSSTSGSSPSPVLPSMVDTGTMSGHVGEQADRHHSTKKKNNIPLSEPMIDVFEDIDPV